MKSITVQKGQSIYDIAIQHYGSLNYVVKLCSDNNIELDAELTAGQLLSIDDTIGVVGVKSIFTLNSLAANNSQVVTPIPEFTYGYLYNAAALTNLAAPGWRVPTSSDYQDLIAYVGVDSALKLMETGTTHWTTGIGTDTVGFSMRGSGRIDSGDGTSGGIKLVSGVRTQTAGFFGKTNFLFMAEAGFTDLVSDFRQEDDKSGNSVRLIKETTTLTHGQKATYTGNDGKVYPTICIGTQEWISVNLKETKYNNGTDIVKCTNNTADWVTLTNAGGVYAAYDNNENLA